MGAGCCCGNSLCATCGWNCALSNATVTPSPGVCQTPKNDGGATCLSNLLKTVATYGTTLTATLQGKAVSLNTKTGAVSIAPKTTPLSGNLVIIIVVVLAAVLLLSMKN